MTTFRRFCCNDLLRLGQINLPSMSATGTMEFYMKHMASWPSNCHVADAPGGRITGYVLGVTGGVGEHCTGLMTALVFPNKGMIDLAEKLSNLLGNCCDKIYNCFKLSVNIPLHNTGAIHDYKNLGFQTYRVDENLNLLELSKHLPLSRKRIMGKRLKRPWNLLYL